MSERTLEIDAGDGTRFGATVFEADRVFEAERHRGWEVILCGPAMGVRATYYRPLAEAWNAAGHPAVTFDMRGIGTSSVRASRRVDFGYREVMEVDLPALVRAVREEFPGRPLVFQGHSLSGQLACLHAARWPASFERIHLVATCSVYYKPWGVGLWLFMHFARLLGAVFGHYPGRRVGFGGREARTLVRDWSHQGFTGEYRVSGTDFDYEAALRGLEVPVHAVHFRDDTFAPREAVEHLLAKMPDDVTSRECLEPADLDAETLGHFDWIRSSDALVARLAERLRTPVRAAASPSG